MAPHSSQEQNDFELATSQDGLNHIDLFALMLVTHCSKVKYKFLIINQWPVIQSWAESMKLNECNHSMDEFDLAQCIEMSSFSYHSGFPPFTHFTNSQKAQALQSSLTANEMHHLLVSTRLSPYLYHSWNEVACPRPSFCPPHYTSAQRVCVSIWHLPGLASSLTRHSCICSQAWMLNFPGHCLLPPPTPQENTHSSYRRKELCLMAVGNI